MASTTDTTTPAAHLHSYFRSSCSARVRTACHLKGIPLTYTYINLLQNDQHSPTYTLLNPSAAVPTFTLIDPSTNTTIITLTQSIAILEFLEDYYPHTTPLLPHDPIARARVRQLVHIIADDIQPLTNLRILQKVQAMGGDQAVWAREVMGKGLDAYEKVVEKSTGKFSVGDQLTMADVVLAPAVEGAMRWGVGLEGWPVLARVFGELMRVEAFRRGSWREQEDTPAELRTATP
ncbi:MAG: hypothetical protein M1813_000296 [Trichoglossum hirsutum]|nr:MAG: hypothetical protein M1813_000296 [Trichoglossum hirsutum]